MHPPVLRVAGFTALIDISGLERTQQVFRNIVTDGIDIDLVEAGNVGAENKLLVCVTESAVAIAFIFVR